MLRAIIFWVIVVTCLLFSREALAEPETAKKFEAIERYEEQKTVGQLVPDRAIPLLDRLYEGDWKELRPGSVGKAPAPQAKPPVGLAPYRMARFTGGESEEEPSVLDGFKKFNWSRVTYRFTDTESKTVQFHVYPRKKAAIMQYKLRFDWE